MRTTKSKPLPSIEYLLECFAYDPETGALTWRSRPREHFGTERAWRACNARDAGAVAGSLNSDGYLRVGIDGALYRAHRIAYALATGTDPGAGLHIDHRDGDRANNRIENLRLATKGENGRNLRGANANSRSGVRGVRWHAGARAWKGEVTLNGRSYHIGYFDSLEEAKEVAELTRAVLYRKFAGHDNAAVRLPARMLSPAARRISAGLLGIGSADVLPPALRALILGTTA
jgi:hypothetical protein